MAGDYPAPPDRRCDLCGRVTEICDCPHEGDLVWCRDCGWTRVGRLERGYGGWWGECVLCGGTVATEDEPAIEDLPTDPREVADVIRDFVAEQRRHRAWDLDFVALEEERGPMPDSWGTTQAADARSLWSALDLLRAARRALLKRHV